MRIDSVLRVPALALCVLLAGDRFLLQAAPPSRIRGQIVSDSGYVLSGNMRGKPRLAVDAGEASSSLELPRISLHFQISQAQQKDLNQLLANQQNRGSIQYHKWLTPEAYGQRFGLSDGDLQKVTAWLQQAGFSDVEVSRSRTFVTMTGTAGTVQAAMGAALHRFTMNGQQHFAAVSDPVLPQALRGVVSSVRGLNDFRPVAHNIKFKRRFTSNISGSHFLAPDDFATIYDLQSLYNGGIDGTGQKIAVVGQTDIDPADIAAFRAAAGLSANVPQVILTGKDPGTTDDQSEADLDIEWAGGVARNATVIFVNSSDAFTSLNYAVDNNVAPVISTSYGLCESQTGQAQANAENTIFQQANAQGQTIVAASGDSGAADCDGGSPDPGMSDTTIAKGGLQVDFPASSPYVTGVGGTEFNEGTGTYWNATNNSKNGSAISYTPEIVWNDTTLAMDLAASGGGASTFFTKPSWQLGSGVPADGHRDVPDVAVSASPNQDGYLICSGGDCVTGFRNTDTTLDVVGGTSICAPTFAGIVALINQKAGSSQGNINTGLYQLASITTDAFHNITTGNNQVACSAGSPNCTTAANGTLGFVATAGYDQTTGLGTPDGHNLVNEFGASFTIAANPTSVTVPAGGNGTASVAVSAVDSFDSAVNFTCTVPSTLTNTTCSIPGTVNGSGNTTLTITNTRAAAVLPRIRWPFGSGTWVLAFLPVLWFRRRRFVYGSALAVMTICLTGCGDGGSSSTSQTVTPPQTGTVTVTATSGVLTQTANVAVTIPSS